MKINKMIKSKIYLTVLLTSAIPSTANSVTTVYHVTGTSCGKYLSDMSASTEYKNAYSWWLAGFVTGTNIERDRVTTTDKYANEAWVKQYCEENPLESFLNAAVKLNEQLESHRLKKQPNN